MSHTNKTRPFEVCQDDLTDPGYISHRHIKELRREIGVSPITGKPLFEYYTVYVPCDYVVNNNIIEYQSGWRLKFHCVRRTIPDIRRDGDRIPHSRGARRTRAARKRIMGKSERRGINLRLQAARFDPEGFDDVRKSHFVSGMSIFD